MIDRFKLPSRRWFGYGAIVCIGIVLASVEPVTAQRRVHSIFFEGTDHELNVYRIHGEKPGKTLLLIGGIQGDEPGGFLSADQYADISLARGNLIVVPRANFQSIVLKRRKINEDMNRKFTGEHKSNYETKIVTILKQLVAESDGLLNLHDGSGFFSEKWEGPDRNPFRYGQSIIADCDVYENPETAVTVQVGAMARSVASEVNRHIKNPEHHFHFSNHRTLEDSSSHKEQRKSATYYAVYTHGIPAYGIETNKSLPLELKVRYHNLVINGFMERFGILPETPGGNLEDPVLEYLIVSINDSLPIAVKNQQTLTINPGDDVMISHIEANYERGLTADIIGYGQTNDLKKSIKIKGPTRIVVRKDYYPCGSIYLALSEKRKEWGAGISVSDERRVATSFLSYRIKAEGKERTYENYSHVTLKRGEKFEIIDVVTNMADPSDLVVNLKGYVSNPSNNTGEDRGYLIDTEKDLLKRYALDREGRKYQIIVTRDDKTIG
ncbi:MAG: M14/M99 family metallopeptidase, partial [Desulfobacterales bacterium]